MTGSDIHCDICGSKKGWFVTCNYCNRFICKNCVAKTIKNKCSKCGSVNYKYCCKECFKTKHF